MPTHIDDKIIRKYIKLVGAHAWAVLCMMYSYDGKCSLYRVAKDLGYSLTTVYKAYAILREHKLARRVGRNSYRLTGGGSHIRFEEVRVTTSAFFDRIVSSLELTTETPDSKSQGKPILTRHVRGKIQQLMEAGIDTLEKLDGYCSWFKRAKSHISFNFGIFCLKGMVMEYAGTLNKKRSSQKLGKRAASQVGTKHRDRYLASLKQTLKKIRDKKRRGEKLTKTDREIIAEGKQAGLVKEGK